MVSKIQDKIVVDSALTRCYSVTLATEGIYTMRKIRLKRVRLKKVKIKKKKR